MANDTNREEQRAVEDGSAKNLPYPKGAFYILIGYLLERFVYYGLFGGAVFYLQRVLEFSASTSNTIKATVEGLIYLAPIAGAIIADSYLGKFRVVFYMCCIYVVGAAIFTTSSIPPLMASVTAKQFAGMLGILIFGLAAGLMKAAYSSFGPDQFILPDQRRQQQRFFYAFYWMINAGAFLGQLITAQLRDSVQCFQYDCYALPFVILCVLMAISLIIFYSGKKSYRQVPPDPLLKNCFKCIFYAAEKSITDREKPVQHWLDRAADKFDAGLISDVKKTARVLVLFLPWPTFWALFFQTSTGMIFQAKRLNGYIGSYRIPPEMMPSINPLIILFLIPCLEYVIYPMLEKRKLLTRETTRMTVGMVLSGIAFIIYGILSMQVEQDILGSRTAQLNVYNTKNCVAGIDANWMPEKLYIKPGESLKLSPINIYNYELTSDVKYECGERSEVLEVLFQEKQETTVVLFPNGPVVMKPTLDYLKDIDAEAKVRMISNNDKALESYSLRYNTLVEPFTLANGATEFRSVNPQNYVIETGNQTLGSIDIRQDGVYDVVIVDQKTYPFTLTAPSNTHVTWLLPQFLLITTGEILFSVSCLDFAYTEAPTSLKSFMQSLDLFTLTIGLWMYAFFTKLSAATKVFEHRASWEAFSYVIFMAINTVMFQFLVNRYYRAKEEFDSQQGNRKDRKEGNMNPAYQESEDAL